MNTKIYEVEEFVEKDMALRFVTNGIGIHTSDLHMEFTFEEIQRFLISRGYRMCIVTGMAQVRNSESDGGGEHREVGDPYDKEFTIFMVYSNELFNENGEIKYKLSSKEVRHMMIDVVFKRELKKKLLYR